MTQRGPNPPEHLRASRELWKRICRDYDLSAHDLARLQTACEALDRLGEARDVLDAQGTTFTDRFGMPRSRPEVAIERDSRLAFLRALRELGLDVVPDEPLRPPSLRR